MSNSETIIGRIIIFKTILLNQGEYINNWQGSFVLHQISPFYLCLLIYLRFIVIDLSVNVYPVCNNKDCKKKINGNPGSRVVKCMACNKSMLVKNCYLDMNVNLPAGQRQQQRFCHHLPKGYNCFSQWRYLQLQRWYWRLNWETSTSRMCWLSLIPKWKTGYENGIT